MKSSPLAPKGEIQYNRSKTSMQLTHDQIEQVAVLARLRLSEAEKNQYATELSAIFGYIETLAEVDTTGVTETSQVTGLEDVMAPDVVCDTSEEIKVALRASFPEKKGELLKVKAVFNTSV